MTDEAVLKDSPGTARAPTLQEPAKPQKRFYFTKENARAYSQKGIEAYRKKLEDARKPLEPAPNDPPELKAALAECERLSCLLAGKLKPLEHAELSKCLDRMLDRVRIIRGFPLPGTATSRAPAADPSPASAMLGGPSPARPAPAIRPPREEQE